MKKTLLLCLAVMAAAVGQAQGFFHAPKSATGFDVKKVSANAAVSKAPKPYSDEIVTEQPAGTLHKNQVKNFGQCYPLLDLIGSSGVLGKTADYVVADDGTVWIKDPITRVAAGTWIKAEKGVGDTLVIHTPQALRLDADGNKQYLSRLVIKYSADSTDNTYDFDPSGNNDIKLIYRNDTIHMTEDGMNYDEVWGLTNADGTWTRNAEAGVWYAPILNEPNQIPADIEAMTSNYVFLAKSRWEAEKDPQIVKFVDVDDGNVWLSNPDNDKQWLHGQRIDRNDSTYYFFPQGQYLGPDSVSGFHLYALTLDTLRVPDIRYGGWTTVYSANDGLTFYLDGDTIRTNSSQLFVLNEGWYGVNENETVYDWFLNPRMYQRLESTAAPKDPYNVYFTPGMHETGDGGYFYDYDAAVNFVIPKEDTDGNFLENENLYVRLYIDGQLYKFTPDEYPGIANDYPDGLTDVPYLYEDSEYELSPQSTYLTYKPTELPHTVGVQSVYKKGSDVRESNITTITVSTSGINTVNADANADAPIYTVTGIRVAKADKPGVYIKAGRKFIVK